jgi:hypothetical protein
VLFIDHSIRIDALFSKLSNSSVHQIRESYQQFPREIEKYSKLLCDRKIVTIQKAHAEDVKHASFSSLEREIVARATTIAGNEPFTPPF